LNSRNPQQDLQAEARAHRLGQTNEVTIFRLVSENTVEEIILARALKKLNLKHSVLDRGKFSHNDEPDPTGADNGEAEEDEDVKLTDVVRFGVKTLCENDESTITEDDIDTILKKGKVCLDCVTRSLSD